MKKINEAKKITVLSTMFLVGFLALANGAGAGEPSFVLVSDLFIEEKSAKGISGNAEETQEMDQKNTSSYTRKGSDVDLFAEEKVVKGVSHDTDNADDSDHAESVVTTVFPSTVGQNVDLFEEERVGKGIANDSN